MSDVLRGGTSASATRYSNTLLMSSATPWKNSEDVVLKTAVMKYGLRNWGRIASLFPTHTQKECKARWQNYLNPALKIGNWSTEEEDELLRLTKMFPQQWKTISDLIDRPANDCIRHYELMMDIQAGGDTATARSKIAAKSEEGFSLDISSKPAIPDSITMSEEEKAMIAEARARLANTHGKKQKRRIREKRLQAAHRLAKLQQKREFQAAGLNFETKITRKL